MRRRGHKKYNVSKKGKHSRAGCDWSARRIAPVAPVVKHEQAPTAVLELIVFVYSS